MASPAVDTTHAGSGSTSTRPPPLTVRHISFLSIIIVIKLLAIIAIRRSNESIITRVECRRCQRAYTYQDDEQQQHGEQCQHWRSWN